MELLGKKFNRLTVIKFAYNKNKRNYWECKCDCGNTTFVTTSKLTTLWTKSCGCARKTHGFTSGGKTSRIYQTWSDMKLRCSSENSKIYKYYGGRGITVCNDWLKFENFYNWAISSGYTDKLTIERLNVNGDYEPKNCTWVTQKIQMRNRRCSVFLMFDGENKTIAEWSEIKNISQKTLGERIKRGWSVCDVLNKPVKVQNGPIRSNLNPL